MVADSPVLMMTNGTKHRCPGQTSICARVKADYFKVLVIPHLCEGLDRLCQKAAMHCLTQAVCTGLPREDQALAHWSAPIRTHGLLGLPLCQRSGWQP